MSAYIPVELQRKVRAHFAGCCAYCYSAEALTVAIFEFEHIIPRSADGETRFENLCLGFVKVLVPDFGPEIPQKMGSYFLTDP